MFAVRRYVVVTKMHTQVSKEHWRVHPDGNSGALHRSDEKYRYECYFYAWNGVWFADFWTSKNKFEKRIEIQCGSAKEAMSVLEGFVGAGGPNV